MTDFATNFKRLTKTVLYQPVFQNSFENGVVTYYIGNFYFSSVEELEQELGDYGVFGYTQIEVTESFKK